MDTYIAPDETGSVMNMRRSSPPKIDLFIVRTPPSTLTTRMTR